jgi:hypothetical protein
MSPTGKAALSEARRSPARRPSPSPSLREHGRELMEVNDAPCPPFASHGASIMLVDCIYMGYYFVIRTEAATEIPLRIFATPCGASTPPASEATPVWRRGCHGCG